jgi:hypothetical protein
VSDHRSQAFFKNINHIIAPTCGTTNPGANLLNRTFVANVAINWTQYAYNYTAISTTPILVFAFYNGGSDYIYLDDVSVADNSAPAIQLLTNPSFENSTTNITGWTTWCATSTTCGTGTPGQVIFNTSCHSGNCYYDHCHNNYDYLVQSFQATIGHIYTISFWTQQVGTTALRFTATVQT